MTTSMSTSKNKSFHIISADHTGVTVSNLERSLAFWRDVLGFELSHTAHQTGELARQITGVGGAEIKLAVVKTPSGHKIELLEYLAPTDRKHVDPGKNRRIWMEIRWQTSNPQNGTERREARRLRA